MSTSSDNRMEFCGYGACNVGGIFECERCGGTYCDRHRSPSKHDCVGVVAEPHRGGWQWLT